MSKIKRLWEEAEDFKIRITEATERGMDRTELAAFQAEYALIKARLGSAPKMKEENDE